MNATLMVIDSSSGCHLRTANAAEVESFWAGQTNPRYTSHDFTWVHPVRISATEAVVDYYGPGTWYGGAGF